MLDCVDGGGRASKRWWFSSRSFATSLRNLTPPPFPLFPSPRRMPLPSPSDQLALYTGTLTALTSSTSSGDLVGLCVGSSFLQLKPKQAKVLLAGETQRALLALNEEG
jgi:hypothetical protein